MNRNTLRKRYAPNLENIFQANLRTPEGRRKWARFFGWEKEMRYLTSRLSLRQQIS
jgi:hypothetical protein